MPVFQRYFAAVLVATSILAISAPVPVRGEQPEQEQARREAEEILHNTLPFWSDEFVQHNWRIQRNVVTGDFRLLNDRDRVKLVGDFAACRACFDSMAKEANLLPVSGKVVIVLHGLFRNHRAGIPLQRKLEKAGYTAIRVNYASTQAGIDSHADALKKIIEFLPAATEINFVGHSMGNIVVRKYLSDQMKAGGKLDPRFKRLVMLGPPNQGSAMAQTAGDASFLHRVAGQGFTQLGREWDQFMQQLAPLPIEFGIIAGNTAEGSQGNPLLEGPDDLVVAVEETKLPGARDFEVLPVIHMRMFADRAVQQHTLNFLEHGYFVSSSQRHPLAAAAVPAEQEEQSVNEE